MNEIYLRKNGILWERHQKLVRGITMKLLLYHDFRLVP